MDKYEQISIVGEGSYGIVIKCKHKETQQTVAIKKFLETEEDAAIRKMALREIRMLKRLKHINLVTMIEVFRFRKRFYLVFEYLEGTVLDELEKLPNGLGDDRVRERIFQVLKGIQFLHRNNVIHRDIKPENVLVSSLGVVKLCDFGFARLISCTGEICTEYVATRWYRAPELLVGEQIYGPAIDIWAVGCLFAEMMTGNALFPGESDIDQLYLIVKLIGRPCSKHQNLISRNISLKNITKSVNDSCGLYRAFSDWSDSTINFLVQTLKMNPDERLTSNELLNHDYFVKDNFPEKFFPILKERIETELSQNPLLWKYKNDILSSSDQKLEDLKLSSSQSNAQKWKINFNESQSIKRKLSGDEVVLPDYNNKLNSVKQQYTSSSVVLKRTANGKCNNHNNDVLSITTSSQSQMFRKTLESLSKASQKSRNQSQTETQIKSSNNGKMCLEKEGNFKKSSLLFLHSKFNENNNSVSSLRPSNISRNNNQQFQKNAGFENLKTSYLTSYNIQKNDQCILPDIPGATPSSNSRKRFLPNISNVVSQTQNVTPLSTSQKSSPSRNIGNYPYS
ncbi:cyclin-dependent kinase-like 4 isoform X2 [Agrilus planipennis]|uniref:cyclin-dependent kinase n=1 Tax=Agrilus planipennis TaxID=224129 RepID=A0A1W4WIU7_AGRPL|nr:cyclin-dependent kinase-like 4 isoform X2 [Agrilus planipennis]